MTRNCDRSTALGFRRVILCVCAALVITGAPAGAGMAAGQAPAEILRYKLSCLLDVERPRAECTADIWVRILRDSLGSVAFRIPAASKIVSVTDAEGSSFDHRTLRDEKPGAKTAQLVCDLPEPMSINDSVLFRIRYNADEDTASASDNFVNEREFLLQSSERSTWAPILVSSAPRPDRRLAAPVVIEMHVPANFTVLSGGRIDSLDSREGTTIWRITRTDASSWDESFTVAGSTIVEPATVPARRAGVCAVSLYTPPGSFDRGFVRSLAGMLSRASEYFAGQSYRPRFERITIASIGEASIDSEPIVSGSLVIVRTGPEHALFDSSAFITSAHNLWLLETARAYAFDVPDSSYWFNESWACYCATRFLFASSDTNLTLQMQERSHILSHALDFYPAAPVAAGRSHGLNEEAVFTYKGRYIFMMLEYVLGRELFDSVMQTLYRESEFSPPSIARLQALSEEAFGSPLSWFFDEWLYRTGFPEYVLSSRTEPTPRGAYEVTVTVTQRGDVFVMPLNVYVETASRSFMKRIFVSQEQQRFTFMVPSEPRKIEWNPQYLVLRWIPRFRILAHARTSTSFRVFSRDLASSEREAHLTLQLDPDNTIGANAIALFSLAKAAGARRDWAAADSLFLAASRQHASGEYSFYPLLSAVRRANILDITQKRDEALAEYRRALEAAERSPLEFGKVIVEARRFLAHPFVPTEDVWFERY